MQISECKDENIYFYDNCLENVKINDVETKVFHAYLTYIPKSCPKCGCINESFDDIIKWNWKRNCKIKISKVSNYNTILLLDKQKFLNIIHYPNSSISSYAKKCSKTLLEMKKYIVNAFDYDLSNGIVEGTNNIIKQVKHNACGYRLFKHLKARVMLIKGLYNPLKA